MNYAKKRHGGKRGHRGPGPGGPPHRARRGAVIEAILELLNERPMHGYDLIEELETKSEGAWRPSPGTIYPALRRMESRGLVSGSTEGEGGKRVYSLTAEGSQRLADRDPDAPSPWEAFAEHGHSLRPVAMELMAQVRQVSRFGTAEQREQASQILTRTKSELYGLMAVTEEPETPAEEPEMPSEEM